MNSPPLHLVEAILINLCLNIFIKNKTGTVSTCGVNYIEYFASCTLVPFPAAAVISVLQMRTLRLVSVMSFTHIHTSRKGQSQDSHTL